MNVTEEELRQFVERVEELNLEIGDLQAQRAGVFADAKGRGYDTKVMRKLIAIRKRRADDVADEEAILEMYRSALGM